MRFFVHHHLRLMCVVLLDETARLGPDLEARRMGVWSSRHYDIFDRYCTVQCMQACARECAIPAPVGPLNFRFGYPRNIGLTVRGS
jgi:hypothetical protein